VRAARPFGLASAVMALQRTAGNRVTAALLQRRPYDEPDYMVAGRLGWYHAPATPATPAAALATTGKESRRVTSTGRFVASWDAISSAITAKPSKGRLRPSSYEALRTAPVSAALLGLSDDARRALAEQVESALLSEVTGGKLDLRIIDGELAEAGPTATAASGGRLGWLLVRDGIHDAFGTLGMARRFYEGKVHKYEFFGRAAPVHEDMAAALDRGVQKFLAMGGKREEINLTTFGGLSIRANTNHPSVLSEHSFGAAVDIDGERTDPGAGVAAGNPNLQEARLAGLGIPGFWGFVQELTGSDVFQRTAKGKKIQNSATGTYEENLAEAQRLREISEKVRGMFASPAAVKRTLAEVVGHYGVEVPAAGQDRLLAAALASAAAFDDVAAATASRDKQLIAAATAAQARADGAVYDVLVELFRPAQGPVDPRAAARVIQIGIAFRGTGHVTIPGVATARAEALGTPGSVAAHGFFNLDPRLVAALTAPDGGNLLWLGATSGTRDSMHFELKTRPDLGYEAPN
jgi:hypothetical protein